MRLNIGSRTPAPGWKTLDIQPGPGVDVVGNCQDLSQFPDNTFDTVYASHVLEHVPMAEMRDTLRHWYRVLQPGGSLMISVPDMNTLAQLFISPNVKGVDKLLVVSMMFGGQSDLHDLHYTGFDFELLSNYLMDAGFRNVTRVPEFGLFNDTSVFKFHGIAISLNVLAKKPLAPT